MNDQLQLTEQSNGEELKLQLPDKLSPMALINKAISNNVALDVLEKLMALQERWEKREAEKAFNEAYNKWQANKPKLIKDKKVDADLRDGGKLQYDYMGLPGIQAAVDPVLGEYGFSYTWDQRQENGKIRIIFILKHVDGHSQTTWLESDLDKSGKKNEIQALGSAVSYLKRYTLKNGLGLSADNDDDGNKLTLTQQEKEDLYLSKLVGLYTEKESNVSGEWKEYFERVIKNKEVKNYQKCVKKLESLNPHNHV